jgi:hypothetical protein
MEELQYEGEVVRDKGNEALSIASTVIPYDREDSEAQYLFNRACGLSVRETLEVIDRTKGWLSNIRARDPQFVELEKQIPEFRKTLSKDFLKIEWMRNFRLAMAKDRKILKRSLGMERDGSGEVVTMTNFDQQYLLKMRTHYSPQQLQVLQAIGTEGDGGINFGQWVLQNSNIVQNVQNIYGEVKDGQKSNSQSPSSSPQEYPQSPVKQIPSQGTT